MHDIRDSQMKLQTQLGHSPIITTKTNIKHYVALQLICIPESFPSFVFESDTYITITHPLDAILQVYDLELCLFIA